MRVKTFNHYIPHIQSDPTKGLRCTFLVPKNYVLSIIELKKKLKIRKTEDLISYYTELIQSKKISVHTNISKHTALYQKEDLDLQRHNFGCDPMVWHHWKRIANHLGVSMCFLYINVLEAVLGGHLESLEAPKKSYGFTTQKWLEHTNFEDYSSKRWMDTGQDLDKIIFS